MRAAFFLIAASTFTILPACRDPTQVTLSIDTNAACADVQGTAVSTGRVGDIESSAPAAQTTACSETGVGTLVLVPNDDSSAAFGVKVALAAGGPLEPCLSPPYANHCIIARRSLRFIPHTPLELPIHMSLDCRGRFCDELTTCADGDCVPADCAVDGTCPPAGGGGGGGGAGGSGGSEVVTCNLVPAGTIVTEAASDATTFGLGVDGSSLFIGSYGKVDELELSTGEAIQSFPQPSQIPWGFGVNETHIFLDQIGVGMNVIFSIDRADPSTIETTPDPLDGNVGHLTILDGSIWKFGVSTAVSDAWRFYEIEVGSGMIRSSFPLPPGVSDDPPRGLGNDGIHLLYLGADPSCPSCDKILHVLETDGTEVCHQPLPGVTSGIADLDADGSRVLVTQGTNVVYVFAPSP